MNQPPQELHLALGAIRPAGSAAPRPSALASGLGPRSEIAFPRSGLEGGASPDDIYVVKDDGSGERNLTRKSPDDWNPVWSPDGRKIAFESLRGPGNSGNSGIYVMNPDGSAVLKLTRRDWCDSAVWSPDGRRIAYIRHFTDPPRNKVGDTTPEIYVMNADGSGQHRLTHNKLDESGLVWSRTGKLAFVRAPRLEPEAWTGPELWTIYPDGRHPRRLTRNGVREDAPEWSPDGRTLEFIRWGKGGRSSIFVMDPDGSRQRRLTPAAIGYGPENDVPSPVWSPNGRKIAFQWGRGLRDIYVTNADGSGRRKLVGNEAFCPSWSPDSRKIAYSVNIEIYVINADGSGKHRIVPRPGRPADSRGGNGCPRWSPR